MCRSQQHFLNLRASTEDFLVCRAYSCNDNNFLLRIWVRVLHMTTLKTFAHSLVCMLPIYAQFIVKNIAFVSVSPSGFVTWI